MHNKQELSVHERAEVLQGYDNPRSTNFFKKPAVRLLSAAVLCAPAVWLLTLFFQLRGYTSLAFSRVDLAATTILFLIIVWMACLALPKWGKRIGACGSLILVVGALILDSVTNSAKTTIPTRNIPEANGRRANPVEQAPLQTAQAQSQGDTKHSLQDESESTTRKKPPTPAEPPTTQPRLLATWKSKYKPETLSLEDLTYLDFGDSMILALQESLPQGPETTPTTITAEVNLQRSDVVAVIYIPAQEQTTEVMLYYSNLILGKLRQIHGLVKPTYQGPGDSNPMASDSLLLSKRVFIYHETPITQEQLIEVDKAYGAQGLSVISRSSAYLLAQRDRWKLEQLSKGNT